MSEQWQSAWVEVVPDLRDFRDKANREMGGILGSAGAAGGLIAGDNISGGILGSIKGLAGPLVGALAALGIGRLVGEAIGTGIRYSIDSVGLASDLAETRSAIEQVFGDASVGIQSFTANANRQLGQTRQQALLGAQTFGVFGKSAGLVGAPLSDFSTGLVTLSADLASFYNSSPDEAIQAIGAGLRGEAEPLRRFGVLLDDATLKQRAMTLGIYDGSGALTSQQRILAAQAEIYAQTGVAQGDFARTSAGLAGQQKIFAASLEDTQAKLGEALLPAFTQLTTYANDSLIPKLDSVIERIGPKLADAIDTAGPKIEQLIDKATPLVEFSAEKGLPFVLDQINKELSDDGFIGGLPKVTENLEGFVGWLTTPIEDTWWDDTVAGFEDFFNTAGGVIRNGSNDLKKYWQGSLDGLIKQTADARAGMYGAGLQFAAGFEDGIETGTEKVALAAERMALAARDKVVGAMLIKSPSRVMAELGGYVAQGFAEGIDRDASLAEVAASSMAAGVIRGAATNVSGGIQFAGSGQSSGPGTLVVVDADGQLIGRMRVEARSEVSARSEQNYASLRGGRSS